MAIEPKQDECVPKDFAVMIVRDIKQAKQWLLESECVSYVSMFEGSKRDEVVKAIESVAE